ncbi:hypothetical protein F4861DRAFT_496615 [Xylaria intraflava]|nr:hypothetical protein F4861DRAFT_496615 [Xylaria intraflava]
MRLWEFDRLGAIASEQFNINEDGQRFVSTILAFLWMDDEALGFDPTIIKSDHQQYIEIQQDMKTKRLILDKPIISGRGIVGRATTCWKAYLEGDESRPLVVKDSWQLLEREEGKLLQEATALGVTNVVRYYHHETVRIRAKDDDVQANIRKGLDITKASNYRIDCAQSLAVEAGIFVEIGKAVEAVEAVSRGNSSLKRPSDQTDVLVPPSKRSRLGSASHMPHPNRIHRRVILCDYGKPIYRASSRVAFLGALEGCIQGHESLYKAGFLHRDISINNLMVNESDKNSLSSFLIDLDLAVMVNQTQPPGAKEMTGTKAFISIGILNGSTGHSFMDDLESFFWVFFWICIHYDEWGRDRVVTEYDNWNFAKPKFLATIKRGVINTEQDFLQTVTEDFTEHYRVLVPWVNELRKVVFPDGRRWEYEDPSLYSRMREILRKAQSDPRV